jgi:hypothetical protein
MQPSALGGEPACHRARMLDRCREGLEGAVPRIGKGPGWEAGPASPPDVSRMAAGPLSSNARSPRVRARRGGRARRSSSSSASLTDPRRSLPSSSFLRPLRLAHGQRPELVEAAGDHQPNTDREHVHRLVAADRRMFMKAVGDSEHSDQLVPQGPRMVPSTFQCALQRHPAHRVVMHLGKTLPRNAALEQVAPPVPRIQARVSTHYDTSAGPSRTSVGTLLAAVSGYCLKAVAFRWLPTVVRSRLARRC